MAALWTSGDAVAATGGRVTRAFEATGLSIDTRTLQPGDLFVALKDVRDGHDFVADALRKGAAGALVSRMPEGCTEGDPLLIVPDVLEGLVALGRAGRARSGAKVVAVTGSVGKTSTKEMLRAVLAGQGRVHAAEASFNNHWGVPITLARMPADADYAVIEIGMNHPGEIAPLAAVARPHVAMITTVAAAHLEAFENVEGIAREKAAIFGGLEAEGIAVVPSGLDVTPILRAAAEEAGATVLTFGGAEGDDYRATGITLAQDRTVVRATRKGEPILFKVQTAGRHFAMNALGVLAVADALGVDPAVAACDLGQWAPPAGRGARERIYLDIVDEGLSFDLIDDAFNANPASMAAALDVLAAAEPRNGIGRILEGRRVAVLGDMLELGPDEAALHAAIATHPAMATIHTVHCVGPRMRALWEALPPRKRGDWRETAKEMAEAAHHIADAGDVVLIKGSKGSKVSIVVDALKKLGQPGAGAVQGTE
ncbi:UDP-N-acetylmuramoyl-tripeptide--D-alanyl-D-alanine ligase [Defluviimonas denitrificans]|jgi:UDP-N-acetylmuramoyl-tripeptide--D-alanyl-D-alanine ligase|uniref:UDP-N-acetylmuramoyl-tripeptide--D-alanyl-D-alanine ligase n=1 Tax=Albidovulum denitrificans TaxID=404881 RepID=A0A2S8SEF5_9RHOB|nr:UDP-N-acetylmuramoyl-tripeptide--D-alanyl-D-alanine ligase [Defluviimonas denitrificans]PQV59129.1 UDP-N-acetylmuramoyl-tripeptide--D-alanyl-D-alanine ligase [Defluviimonas denitrificans]